MKDKKTTEETTDVAVIEKSVNIEDIMQRANETVSAISNVSDKELKALFEKGKAGIKITSNYLLPEHFEQGVTRRFMFLNTGIITVDGDKLPAVTLMDEDMETYVSASARIVSSLSQFKPPMMVDIVYTGTKNKDKKTIHMYEVFTVNY
jgi:hypothetical protein